MVFHFNKRRSEALRPRDVSVTVVHFSKEGKLKMSPPPSYHTEPVALHVWSIDGTLQVDNPTLVWAQPGGGHSTVAR